MMRGQRAPTPGVVFAGDPELCVRVCYPGQCFDRDVEPLALPTRSGEQPHGRISDTENSANRVPVTRVTFRRKAFEVDAAINYGQSYFGNAVASGDLSLNHF